MESLQEKIEIADNIFKILCAILMSMFLYFAWLIYKTFNIKITKNK
jgi:hypothetical protein